MEGQVTGSLSSLRVTRQAEPSRLQLEHVRRAFELLVSHSRYPVARRDDIGAKQFSAATALLVTTKGD